MEETTMQAKIFFGDVEVTKTQTETIKNPYDGKESQSFLSVMLVMPKKP